MTKKLWKTFVTLAMFCLFCCLITLTSSAANPKRVTLKPGTTYTKYDITGDGKADTIQISTTKDAYDVYTGFSLKINGKSAFTVRNDHFYSTDIKLYTLQNKKAFVYLYLEADNSDGPACGLFKYSNGRLKQVVNFQNFFKYGMHNCGKVTSVSKNTLKVELYSMSWAFGPTTLKYTFKYKNGTLVPASRIGKVSVNAIGSKYGTAKQSIQLYRTATSNRKKLKITAGQRFKITDCYVKGSNIRFKVKLSNGKTGWLKSPKKYFSNGPFISESFYAG